MTLKQMLAIKGFEGMTVLAGKKGVHKHVTSATVIDAPDLYQWLKGGEVIMSSGYLIKDDPDLFTEIIHRLHKAGAVAFMIKLNRFISSIPDAVVKAADSLNFPIIQMPIDLAWVDVINPILIHTLNKQMKIVSKAHDIHDHFTKIVVDGGDLSQIIQTLSQVMGFHFFYQDALFDQTYCSDETIQPQDILHSSLTDNSMEPLDTIFECCALKEGGRLLGTLYCLTPKKQLEKKINADGQHLLRVAMEHAATVIKLFIQKKSSNLEIENRYKNEFVLDLITNNINYPEEVYRRAEIYGWELSGGRTAVIVDIDDFKQEYRKLSNTNRSFYYTLEAIQDSIFHLAKKIIDQSFDESVFASFSDSVIFLVKTQSIHSANDFDKELREVSKKICHEISTKFPFTVTVGIGNHKDAIMDIHQSYTEAKKAIKISQMQHHKNTVIQYQDLGIYELLANISDTAVVRNFSKTTLQKLKEYDLRYNAKLCHTLSLIIDSNWNLREAARKGFVHYNTIKYRYKKIEEILGENLENPNVKIKLSISIKLEDII